MASEQEIVKDLITRFGLPADKVTNPRERRIFAYVPAAKFDEIFNYIMDKLGYDILCTITGLDEVTSFGVMYHLATLKGSVLNLHVTLPREKPVIKTVTARFPAADRYEREINDLLGIKIDGLAPGQRYPLPDEWPANDHPLRKDWKEIKP